MTRNATHPSETFTVTSADRTTIAVDRSGHGPTVVCVDGAMSTRSLGPAKMLAPHLAEAFTSTATTAAAVVTVATPRPIKYSARSKTSRP